MMRKILQEIVRTTYEKKRRLVVPLVGFPGLNITGCTIKLAQQNYGEHFKVVKAIAERFHPDAIFPMMDLSVEANALGRYTVFPKEESATVIKDSFSREYLSKVGNLKMSFDTRLLGYVETLKLMNIGLPPNILRGAYVTGPYTLAALMMGADEAALATIMNKDDLNEICRFATEKILEYVRLLITAGAQIICILEPSAVMLGPEQFVEFSGKYVRHITQSCEYTGVSTVYHICGNTMHLVKDMCDAGVDALSLDAPETGVDLPAVAKQVPGNVLIIGNISPVGNLLSGKQDDVEKDVLHLLNSMESFPNFILSSGCDLPQETPLENIEAFMNAGRNYRLN
jgi:uroporphyrinogen decarboxylase